MAADISVCPGVNSASKNEYQDIPGGKGGRCVRVTTLTPSCAECLVIWSLNRPEPSGPHRPVTGELYLYILHPVVFVDHSKTNRLLSFEHNCCSLFWYICMFRSLLTVIGLSVQYCMTNIYAMWNLFLNVRKGSIVEHKVTTWRSCESFVQLSA